MTARSRADQQRLKSTRVPLRRAGVVYPGERVPTADVVLPFPDPITPLRHARSTVLVGSLAVVRASDRWAVYCAALAPEHREILLNAVAATWIPIAIALAHYAACEVAFPEAEVLPRRPPS